SGQGVVFQLNLMTSAVTPLHAFTGGADGAQPVAGLVRDAGGNLYGTTLTGGANGKGVVFKLDPANMLTVPHTFAGGGAGANPRAELVLDSTTGNLYGTTYAGDVVGIGMVFKLSPANMLTILHTFTGGADGANPQAGLLRDSITGN